MKIAVVGSGISGLAAALRLSARHAVTLFEAEHRLGGHTNTVDLTIGGQPVAVDTGFLVLNQRTYPRLLALFAELDVPLAATDMSFSVSMAKGAGAEPFEWCGSDLSSLFAQPRNALSPAFWRMLLDIARFNREATRLALAAESAASAARESADHTLARSLGDYLADHGYGRYFRERYLLPMAGAIWSCAPERVNDFPLGTFVRFFHNHGLLQVRDRPPWYTVRGGARQYVERIRERLSDVRTGTPVRRIVRVEPAGALLHTDAGSERFDRVVLAVHSDQALRILADADADERRLLQAIPYQPNRAVLHADAALMPRRRAAWAAWNYLSAGGDEPRVSVTYWLNRLQPLPVSDDLFVTLNPIAMPRADRVFGWFDYDHPLYTREATEAWRNLPSVQGRRSIWFAGAWTGYGFHEDGLRSGLEAAAAIDASATDVAESRGSEVVA